MPGVKKEQLEVLPPLQEIGRAELLRDDAVYYLGLMAAKGLTAFGQITLIMGADDKVCVANPVHVYLDAQAIIDDAMPVDQVPNFKYVRPVLGSGRPQYCAWKEGELWEIEFIDEEPEENPSRGNHQ